jgi:hypothetical protein
MAANSPERTIRHNPFPGQLFEIYMNPCLSESYLFCCAGANNEGSASQASRPFTSELPTALRAKAEAPKSIQFVRQLCARGLDLALPSQHGSNKPFGDLIRHVGAGHQRASATMKK